MDFMFLRTVLKWMSFFTGRIRDLLLLNHLFFLKKKTGRELSIDS
jgi:hypothetical protein